MAATSWNQITSSGQSKAKGKFELTDDKILWKNTSTQITSKYPVEVVVGAVWFENSKVYKASGELELELDGGAHVTFAGFRREDKATLAKFIQEKCKVEIETDIVNTNGRNWGEMKFEGSAIVFRSGDDKRIATLPYEDISQCAVPTKREIEIQFEELDDETLAVEELVEVRMYIPEDAADGEPETALQEIKSTIKEKANIRDDDAGVIVDLASNVGQFLVPRGKYAIELFSNHMRMHGKTYDYRIRYTNIERLLLLESPQQTGKYNFIISLKRAIRQGQQQYDHLTMVVTDKKYILNVQLDEDEIEEKFGKNSLKPEMTDQLFKLVAKCFKFITKHKIYSVGKFVTHRKDVNGQPFKALRVACGANNGYLYPLKKSFMYIHKPAVHIPYSSIDYIEFHRFDYQNMQASRTFDMEVAYGEKSRVFKNIEKNEFENLCRFVESKSITIRNKPQKSYGARKKEVDEFMGESDEEDSDYRSEDDSEEDEDYENDEEDEDDAPKRKRSRS